MNRFYIIGVAYKIITGPGLKAKHDIIIQQNFR